MNYDDVLEFIQKDINDAAFKRNEYYPSRSLLALRTVVELHKPTDSRSDSVCANCPTHNYPCPTIQAIQLELD